MLLKQGKGALDQWSDFSKYDARFWTAGEEDWEPRVGFNVSLTTWNDLRYSFFLVLEILRSLFSRTAHANILGNNTLEPILVVTPKRATVHFFQVESWSWKDVEETTDPMKSDTFPRLQA